MPSYKVNSVGFYDGITYSPDGKRPILTVDKPFSKKEMPSWVTLIKQESAAARKEREDELVEANAKVEADKKEVSKASFLGTGETVETL